MNQVDKIDREKEKDGPEGQVFRNSKISVEKIEPR